MKKETQSIPSELGEMELIVQNVVEQHLGKVESIERLRTGICNEVFAIEHNGVGYIVRMNKNVAEMRGSSLFIPKLDALGIRVPKIVAEEYNTSHVGFGYQILERLPGTDLGNVIESLSIEQLKSVAVDVAEIFCKLRTVPTDGTYGLVMDEHGGKFSNWLDWMKDDLKISEQRARKTGFIQQIVHLVKPVHRTLDRYEFYFVQVPSTTYYGDIAGKNVLVDNGKFSGLVDLDALAYGDWLEAIGRIRASWYGSDYGETYTRAVMDALELNDEQRSMVCVYSLHHRFAWMCENGVAFNANTTGTIDQEKAMRDIDIVSRLLQECA